MTPERLDIALKRTHQVSVVSGLSLAAVLAAVLFMFPQALSLRDEVRGLRTQRDELSKSNSDLASTKSTLEGQVTGLRSEVQRQNDDLKEVMKQGFVPVATSGWVYVGKFENGTWLERNLAFDESLAPATLNGKTFPTTTNLFVRTTPPRMPNYVKGSAKGVVFDELPVQVSEMTETRPGIWWGKVVRR